MRRSTTLSAVVLAAGMFLLSGCGSGQSAQTAYQDATKVGVNTVSLDGKIALRDVHVKYAPQYPAGGNAPLVVRIFNEGEQQATLTSVTASGGGTVVVASRVAPTTAPPATPSATPSASASPSGTRRPNGSASATPSGSAAPTSAAPPPVGTPSISIPIPVSSFVVLVPGESDRWLVLDKLPEALKAGSHVVLTFTFTYADGSTTRVSDLRVPMGVPFSPGPRLTPSGGGEH